MGNETLPLIDTIVGAFLTALEQGGHTLGVYSLPILGICAVIHFRWEMGLLVMRGNTQLGDALASFLLLIVSIGFYYWIIVNLHDMANAALGTAFQWGAQATGSTVTMDMLKRPSWIIEAGMKAAEPIAAFDTFWRGLKSAVGLVANPLDAWAYMAIMVGFFAIAGHQSIMLIEFFLSVMCATVLIPWGIWRASASLGEFAFGWIVGGLIRTFVGTAMIGVGVPLFQTLKAAHAGVPMVPDSLLLVAGAWLFAVLCCVIPARASRMASGASLALSGSTVISAAMTTARFSTMASAATSVVRGHSPLVHGRS